MSAKQNLDFRIPMDQAARKCQLGKEAVQQCSMLVPTEQNVSKKANYVLA
jgi:hypothetical protein